MADRVARPSIAGSSWRFHPSRNHSTRRDTAVSIRNRTFPTMNTPGRGPRPFSCTLLSVLVVIVVRVPVLVFWWDFDSSLYSHTQSHIHTFAHTQRRTTHWDGIFLRGQSARRTRCFDRHVRLYAKLLQSISASGRVRLFCYGRIICRYVCHVIRPLSLLISTLLL